MPKAAGKWNTYEITAQGSHLVVVLNGQKTADVQDSKHNAGGPFALQYGSGVVKAHPCPTGELSSFRNVAAATSRSTSC